MFSHNIPEFDILARLPVKSLLWFICVRKSWKILVSSPSFKDAHLEGNIVQSSCDYLLIQTDYKKNCLSLFDAEALSKCLDIELPADKLAFRFFVHGSCNGLVCISDYNFSSLNNPIYLWNPSVRKLKTPPNGLIQHTSHFVNLGFGFHSGENDYNVMRLVRVSLPCENVVLEVEFYSLRSDAWRRITAMPSFSDAVIFWQSRCTFFEGAVYWIITEPSHISGLAFDMSTEVARKIVLLPEFIGQICTGVFDRSLSLFHTRHGYALKNSYFDIWVQGSESGWPENDPEDLFS